jgi:hypothetical protein
MNEDQIAILWFCFLIAFIIWNTFVFMPFLLRCLVRLIGWLDKRQTISRIQSLIDEAEKK